MDKAYIHASISTSLQVAELSLVGQVIFDRAPAHADHQGRLPGHPRKVKAIVVPLIDVSLKNVTEQLRKMHDLGLIVWYEVREEKYIQLVTWWKFQDRRFAHPSKYPAPEGWKDRLRYHHPVTHELIEVNWDGRYGKKKREGDRKEPTQDPYVGPLHTEPTQGPRNAPSATATATATATEEDQRLPAANAAAGSPPANQPGKGNGSDVAPPKPKSRRKRECPPEALRIWEFYCQTIARVPAKKADALRNITARLKEGYTEQQLGQAVAAYATECAEKAIPEDRRFHGNNFFGMKKYFEGYVPQQRPEGETEEARADA